ncbi:MAG: oxidoreductase family protein [Ktedonobacteraceae bacterium]
MNLLSLPIGPEEVTPEWLTAIFRENKFITSEVVDANIDIIGQDWGFTGVMARVRLQYASREENAPDSVVVKFPTATRDTSSAYHTVQQQDEIAARRYFERCAREVAFYQQVAPMNSISVPCLYYGAVDSAANRVVLVLEDLRNARVGDALRGCSSLDAALVIDELAKFHTRWWNHPQLDTFNWLPLWGGDALSMQNRYAQLIGPFFERFGQRVSRQVREIIDALATSYGAVRQRLQQAPVTMIHGDLHLDNIFFHALEHRSPVTVIDWQSVARGRGAIDLALFLFGSLETATRRAVEDDLLQRYYELLIEGGVTGYNFAQLIKDCRLALLWLLGANVVWLGSLDIDSLKGREKALVEASLQDGFAALLDYDAGSLLPL